MSACDFAANREAESDPRDFLSMEAFERRKNQIAVLGVYADPVVPDRNRIAFCILFRTYFDFGRFGTSKFQRV